MMSRQDVEVVRRFHVPYEGEDLVPPTRAMVERIGDDPQRATVLAAWAEDPAWQHVHPEIEWDVSAGGVLGGKARGAREMALWWAEWVEVWASYVYRVVEHRDLGDWVLTSADVRARGRDGVPIEMRIFQLWQVRDGRIAAYRAFFSEQEALQAAGAEE